MVADQTELQRDAAGTRIPDRGRHPGIGDRHHHIGVHRVLEGQVPPHLLPAGVDRPAEDDAVRTAEIDMLENTKGGLPLRQRHLGFQAFLLDPHHFPGRQVPDMLRVDQVEGAGFRSHDVGSVHKPQAEGPEALRVPGRQEVLRREQRQGVGPLDHSERFHERFRKGTSARPGHQVQDDLAVTGRVKNGAVPLEFLAQLRGVGQVAVVSERDLSAPAIDQNRLCVPDGAFPGGGIAHVPQRRFPGEPPQPVFVEHVRHVSHPLFHVELAAVGDGDPGGVLPPVLQGVQAQVGDPRGLRVGHDAENAAFLSQFVPGFHLKGPRQIGNVLATVPPGQLPGGESGIPPVLYTILFTAPGENLEERAGCAASLASPSAGLDIP